MLRKPARAQSFADDVLCAESSAGYCPPAALIQETYQNAAFTRGVDNYAAATTLVRCLHRLPHQGGIDWNRGVLATDRKEEPRLKPIARLKLRLDHCGMLAAHVEIRFQFITQSIFKRFARLAGRPFQCRFSRFPIGGCGEEGVLGDLDIGWIETIQPENKFV